MRKTLLTLALGALFILPGYALQGGTDMGTYNVGGNFAYDAGTTEGADLDLNLHFGMYYRPGLLLGIDGGFADNDVTSSYKLSALCQYHFLDNWLVDANGRPSAFSPYAGVLLGIAHGENPIADGTGMLLGARLGCDLFFTQNIALVLNLDVLACTSDVYADDRELKSSDIVLSLGFDFFF